MVHNPFSCRDIPMSVHFTGLRLKWLWMAAIRLAIWPDPWVVQVHSLCAHWNGHIWQAASDQAKRYFPGHVCTDRSFSCQDSHRSNAGTCLVMQLGSFCLQEWAVLVPLHVSSLTEYCQNSQILSCFRIQKGQTFLMNGRNSKTKE